ncbi:MAG: protease modulator HflC [Cellvibrionaceae bacterium]
MNGKSVFLSGIVVVALLVASNSLFIVDQRQTAVMLKFGRVVSTDIQPGLHWKWPVINDVKIFDARILTSRTQTQRFLTVEKKGMIVDYFVKWRIFDVEKYYTATNGDEISADQAIARPVNEGLRNEIGERTLQEVVSGERDELMADLIKKVSEESKERLGVEIIDVRVKRIDLPEDVSESVFNRMKAEREQEAREHRSEGKEKAEAIRADADRQAVVIEADAYKEAEQLRGDGDARSSEIYASAFNKDPEFYSFVRSLSAYKETFKSRNDVLLVDPESDFFRYLNNSSGKK